MGAGAPRARMGVEVPKPPQKSEGLKVILMITRMEKFANWQIFKWFLELARMKSTMARENFKILDSLGN